MTEEERRARIYPIILTEYNPGWATWYAEEKCKIESIIGAENIAKMHHYGSTSIPGMFAKPTVDILLEVPPNADTAMLKERMKNAGYICLDKDSLTMETPPPHLMFLKGYLQDGFAEQVFHIHVRHYSGKKSNELYFRGYLIRHPDTAKEYAALKRTLWKDFEHNRDGYTAAKGTFIQEVTKRALEETE